MGLSDIPLEAYNYVVNGKPAIEWIMERYAVTVDKDSGIKNDPNEWSTDPRYIVDLLKRIVRVSLETVKIVDGLPGGWVVMPVSDSCPNGARGTRCSWQLSLGGCWNVIAAWRGPSRVQAPTGRHVIAQGDALGIM